MGSLLLAGLSGCSGSPFGESLSRSFSTPPAASPNPTRPAPAGNGSAQATTANPAIASGSANAGATAATPSAGRPGANGSAAISTASGSAPGQAAGRTPAAPGQASPSTAPAPGGRPGNPARPAPYRVTILLPQADASAPAEVVTEALRAAGVPFEVETIERIGRTNQPEAPLSRPAPQPR